MNSSVRGDRLEPNRGSPGGDSVVSSTDRVVMIRQRLTAALNPQRVDIVDESHKHVGYEGAKGGGGHFKVTIVCEAFNGKSLLARHRMVYDAMGDAMQREIHALSIKALTPEEA